jgi:hypothetical protein
MTRRVRAAVKIRKKSNKAIIIAILILLGLFLLSRTRQMVPVPPQRVFEHH